MVPIVGLCQSSIRLRIDELCRTQIRMSEAFNGMSDKGEGTFRESAPLRGTQW